MHDEPEDSRSPALRLTQERRSGTSIGIVLLATMLVAIGCTARSVTRPDATTLACVDLKAVDALIREYGSFVRSGGTDLANPNLDFNQVRAFASSYRQMAGQLMRDADGLRTAQRLGGSELQDLADSLRLHADRLVSLGAGIPPDVAGTRAAVERTLGC